MKKLQLGALAIILAVGTFLLFDELRLRAIRPGMNYSDALERLGQPDETVIYNTIPPPREVTAGCQGAVVKKLLYQRLIPRSSLVVLLDKGDRVICTKRPLSMTFAPRF